MNFIEIPSDLKKLVANEKIDFCVKAKYDYSKSESYGMMVVGIVWMVIIGFFGLTFLDSLFFEKGLNLESNGLHNWESLMMPGIVIGIFFIAGLLLFIRACFVMFKEGGYFVGTETRLIQSLNDKITITNWNQFSGNVKLRNKNNFGDIEFKLKTGKIIASKNNPDRFVPDVIYIAGINDVLEIEKLCQIRIKKNNSTLVNAIQ